MILQIYKDNSTINIFDSIQLDWTSIDNIVKWGEHAEYLLNFNIVNDYKVLRSKIKSLVEAITGSDYSNFNLLSKEEQYIAAESLINKIPNDKLIAIEDITEDKLKSFGNMFNINSIQARTIRLNKAKETAFTLYNRTSCLFLLAEINGGYMTYSLSTRYIDGIESLADDGYDGLIDFIYTLDNQAMEQYIETINGLTLTQAKNILLDVIVNGIY